MIDYGQWVTSPIRNIRLCVDSPCEARAESETYGFQEVYTLRLNEYHAWTCTCPYYSHHHTCKHLDALEPVLRMLPPVPPVKRTRSLVELYEVC